MNSAVRVILLFAGLTVLGLYSYYTLQGPQGISALFAKQAQIRQLEVQNADLVRQIQYKRERIRKFNESESARDLEVRKKLKMLHENETEFILPKGTVKPDNDEDAP